ncbi:MAG: hypothetical protein C0403_11265 [Desulfobacterium sp.]|nr:hypothetical protein [Desulfobacterium sp.]
MQPGGKGAGENLLMEAINRGNRGTSIHDKYCQEKNNTSPLQPQLHFSLAVKFCSAGILSFITWCRSFL